MRTRIAVIATISGALLLPAASGYAQTPEKAATLTIAGHAGEAKLLQIDGKSYVEIETLARLTKGTLSFKDNRTTLTLPPADAAAPAPQPQVKAGVSRTFVRSANGEPGSSAPSRRTFRCRKNGHRRSTGRQKRTWLWLPPQYPQTTTGAHSPCSLLNSTTCKN